MIDDEILNLTKSLIEIESINGTSGEKDIAIFIEDFFRNLPYFKAHPENIIINKLPNDKLSRRSVIIIVEGEKTKAQPNSKIPTVLLNGHIDTVGIDDFGPLKEFATKPDILMKKMASSSLPFDAKADLDSKDYLFGRGASDMKSGDAVFMTLVKRASFHPENFSGNIVLSLNPVEENAHTGIITSLPVFKKLRDEKNFDFICAINNDFTTKLFEGDDKVTIYTGMGGKILPCFYILGRETHVGQCFEGLDASLIASKLVSEIEFSTKHADLSMGEMAPPPTVLKIKDLKSWYNVQTAKESFLYFNYFVYEKSVQEITKELLSSAKKAVKAALKVTRENQERFDKSNALPYSPRDFDVKIMSYDELYNMALIYSETSSKELNKKLSEIEKNESKKNVDVREMPIALIRYLLSLANITEPAVVLYYAPPYVPHCRLKYIENGASLKSEGLDNKDNLIYEILKDTLAEVSNLNDVDFRILHYYPSLSDSSYLSIDDDEESIATLKKNFPQEENTLNVPLDAIKDLSIPTLNIGDFGVDAHKWTERVNIPYTFGILPELEKKLILRLLEAYS